MDQDRFDQLARAVGSGRSRRSLLKGLGAAALGAAGLGRIGAAEAGGTSNSAAAHFCTKVFGGGTSAQSLCVSQAAHGAGPFVDCGGNTANYCNGACTDITTDVNNCGACNTGCDDGNLCTTDTCSAGQCVHTPIVLNCTASDQCHVAGVCDPGTGQCSNPDAADGISCNDGNHCTSGDTCQTGQCVGGAAVVCTPSGPCVTSTCDPAIGCVEAPKASGVACDDATLCNGHETCDGSGHCVAGTPVSCSPCLICDPATGTCNPDPAQVGLSCPSNGNLCEGGFQCTAGGTCEPTTFVTCAALDQCHAPGVCNPSSGVCTNPNKGDGEACNDGNACTQTDTCQAGQCVGGNPVVCTALDQCHDAGTCNTATGVCSNPIKANNTPCNDGNACTVNDVCTDGACHGTAITCPAGTTCRGGVCAGQGTCPAGADFCASGTRTHCDGSTTCTCYTTTSGATFCSSNDNVCSPCNTDADCGRAGWACVVIGGESCSNCPGSSTPNHICVAPCPYSS